MMTWQVVHAQLPPQACSSGTWRFFATSRNDSGLPWCEYGSLPVSNSTTVGSPSMMKVTLGMSDVVHIPAGESGSHGTIHHYFGEMLRRVIERLGPFHNGLSVRRGKDHFQRRQHAFDLLAFAGLELVAIDLGHVGRSQ